MLIRMGFYRSSGESWMALERKKISNGKEKQWAHEVFFCSERRDESQETGRIDVEEGGEL